jgi:hypothetical protein
VNVELTRVGIDYQDGRCYLAQVRYGDSVREAVALACVEKQELNDHRLLENSELILTVPDSEVVVKRFLVDESAGCDVHLQAQFELSMSMLDAASEFCFDVICSDERNRCLGLVIRRNRLQQLADELLVVPEGNVPVPLKYGMRAVALGKGYLNFCERVEDGLVGIVDFGNTPVSVCLIAGGEIVDVGCLSSKWSVPLTSQDMKNAAVEFTTLVNYMLARTFPYNQSAPELSTLIVLGDDDDTGIASALRRHFRTDIVSPRIDGTVLGDTAQSLSVPVENFLVALGLTID